MDRVGFREGRQSVVVRLGALDGALALGAVAFLLIAVTGRDAGWGQGYDQQVYAELAVVIANTGRAALKTHPAAAADAELLRAVGTDRPLTATSA